MPKLVALNNIAHREVFIDQEKIEGVGAKERMIPVVLSEFLKLAIQYPIVFTKNADTGQFVCVTLLGFENQENLFWQNNQWDGLYLPLNVTRQPFFIGHDASNDETVICIDTDSACISNGNGERIFDGEGKDTQYFNKVKTTLTQLMEGEEQTRTFIDTLIRHKLLMPLSLDVTLANDSKQTIQGVYTIDEENLEKLPGEVITELHQQKYLKPIYTIVSSLGHIYSLIQRKNQRIEK